MGEGGGDGIDSVVDLFQLFDFQDLFDHELDLLFISRTVAGNCRFYLQGRVTIYFQARKLASQKDHASSGTDRHDCFSVGGEKKFFNGGLAGSVLPDDPVKFVENDLQADIQVSVRRSFDATRIKERLFAFFFLNNCPAETAGARIDP